jgi:hypothetical protein
MASEQTPGTSAQSTAELPTTYQEVHPKIEQLLKEDKFDEAQELAYNFSKRTHHAAETGDPLTFSEAEEYKPPYNKSPISQVSEYLNSVGKSEDT